MRAGGTMKRDDAVAVLMSHDIEADRAASIVDGVIGMNAAIDVFLPLLDAEGLADGFTHNGWKVVRDA